MLGDRARLASPDCELVTASALQVRRPTGVLVCLAPVTQSVGMEFLLREDEATHFENFVRLLRSGDKGL